MSHGRLNCWSRRGAAGSAVITTPTHTRNQLQEQTAEGWSMGGGSKQQENGVQGGGRQHTNGNQRGAGEPERTISVAVLENPEWWPHQSAAVGSEPANSVNKSQKSIFHQRPLVFSVRVHNGLPSSVAPAAILPFLITIAALSQNQQPQHSC